MMPGRPRLIVICAILQLCCSALAFAEEGLLSRAPAGANAIVAADVALFMKTPMARRENWDAHDAARGPESPSPLPSLPDLRRLVLVSRLNTETADPVWEAAVLEFTKTIPTGTITSRVGGYVDTVGGKATVRTRGDTFFVQLDERTVGAAFLADRQFVNRWVGHTAAAGAQDASAYLRDAVAQVGAESPIVLAIDLAEAVSEVSVRRMLERDPPAALSGAAVDPAALAATLASIKGVTVKVAVKEGAVGTATFDFAKPASPLAAIAKPLILEVVASRGMDVPDLGKWEFAVNGNTVTATGSLSPESLHRLMTVLQAPSSPEDRAGGEGAARPAADGRAPSQQNSKDDKQTRIAASQRYYRSIGQIMDGLKPGPSLEATAAWLARDARRIDQLPIADVDPDLMAWGVSVGAALRQAGSIYSTGQQSVRASVVAVENPYGYSTGTGYDFNRDRDNRANDAEARRQNRQAMSAQKAQISAAASEPLQRALDSRAAIRADMVKRYGVNF